MDPSGALGRLLVVEVGDSPAGAYCGRLFGGYGAQVVRIEPRPRPGPTPEAAAREFYRQGKFRIEAGSPEAAAALGRADVVIRASADGPLPEGPAARRLDLPGVWPEPIEVLITPFGSDGPYARWRSSDLIETALAGHLRLSGDPGAAPLAGVPDLGRHAAGVVGFIGALAALVARVRIGVVQTVEVNHHEVLAALHQFTLCRYTHNGAVLQRHGNRYAGPGAIIGAYRCRDGWISLALPTEDMVERMLDVTGLASLLEDPAVGSVADLMVDLDRLNGGLMPYLAGQDRHELIELWQALRLPIAPISTLGEVLADPHLAQREFWDGPASGGPSDLRLPGAPFRLSGHRWSSEPSVRAGSMPVGGTTPNPGEGRDLTGALADGPLTGLRVLDLTRVWAGPLAARILADLGADVLCVEGPWARCGSEVPASFVQATRYFPDDDPGPDPWNRMAFHNKYALNKRSVVIDLNRPEGVELLRGLIPTADVMVENYSPRVMPSFGLDQETVRGLNPDLVSVTMPGYGRQGPNADWVAYGPTIDGHAGHNALMGYRDQGPWKCGIAWPDPIGGLHAAAGALVALLDRFERPESGGQTVEVAQIEAAVTMIGQHLARAQMVGPGHGPASRRDGGAAPTGNRREGPAPQGVYPCARTDRWVALSVPDDEAWVATCGVLGLGDLTSLDRGARIEASDELDRRIAACTSSRDDGELARALQNVGVAAAPLADAADVLADPQLAAAGFFVELDHPSAGRHRWPRLPITLSATPATVRSPAPLMGADNEYAACELAGLDAGRYRELVEMGVLLTEPPD